MQALDIQKLGIQEAPLGERAWLSSLNPGTHRGKRRTMEMEGLLAKEKIVKKMEEPKKSADFGAFPGRNFSGWRDFLAK
jgi:hypothetical protein